MAKADEKPVPEKETNAGATSESGGLQKKEPEAVARAQSSPLLFGTEANGASQVALAIEITSDGKPVTVMAPDLLAEQKVFYITKPVKLSLDKLALYLQKKGISLPESLTNVLKNTDVTLGAFYVSTGPKEPLLLMFKIEMKTGLIESITGDKDLGTLFDIRGASVRVFRCEEKSLKVLETYVAELTA